MNEVEKFFSDLPSEDTQVQQVFEQKTEEKATEEVVEDPEKEEEGRKNRRHRRLEEKLQAERESNIALQARIQALSEAKAEARSTSTSTMPSEWIALYGDNEAAQKAWQMQERLFDNVAAKAKEEALQEFETRQQQAADEQKKFESQIDSELEALEDEHNIDLTSDSPKARKARREFLEMVQSLSPKDTSGSIISYADFGSAFELYQKTQADKPDASRAKEIASRSMQASGPVNNAAASDDSERAYLRSIGIRGI